MFKNALQFPYFIHVAAVGANTVIVISSITTSIEGIKLG